MYLKKCVFCVCVCVYMRNCVICMAVFVCVYLSICAHRCVCVCDFGFIYSAQPPWIGVGMMTEWKSLLMKETAEGVQGRGIYLSVYPVGFLPPHYSTCPSFFSASNFSSFHSFFSNSSFTCFLFVLLRGCISVSLWVASELFFLIISLSLFPCLWAPSCHPSFGSKLSLRPSGSPPAPPRALPRRHPSAATSFTYNSEANKHAGNFFIAGNKSKKIIVCVSHSWTAINRPFVSLAVTSSRSQ